MIGKANVFLDSKTDSSKNKAFGLGGRNIFAMKNGGLVD